MYPFFPLPPRHDEQLMASGVAAGASEFDFLADTELSLVEHRMSIGVVVTAATNLQSVSGNLRSRQTTS
jgi:hypothetical protein